jgi:MoxR-like ATPase
MENDRKLAYRSLIHRLQNAPLSGDERDVLDAPDRRDGLIYDYDEELHLATEVALATGRPLLLRGDPGSGKSSFAAYVARNLNWRYYEHTVTAQTNAEDFLWHFDLVRRLADAQARARPDSPPLNDLDYIEPGVLWWIFDRNSARRRGGDGSRLPAREAVEPNATLNALRDQDCAVLLIDELDKADPEVPNALLVPLGSMQFPVPVIPTTVSRRHAGARDARGTGVSGQPMSRLLVVITTNEERDLPPAFLRRCVVHKLEHPNPARLVQIARLHFNRPGHSLSADAEKVCIDLASRLDQVRTQMKGAAKRPPGTAEYLDAIRACIAFNVQPGGGKAWEVVERTTLLKD